MAYERDLDSVTRGVGAIAAADHVSRTRHRRRVAVGRALRQRDRQMSNIARGSLGAISAQQFTRASATPPKTPMVTTNTSQTMRAVFIPMAMQPVRSVSPITGITISPTAPSNAVMPIGHLPVPLRQQLPNTAVDPGTLPPAPVAVTPVPGSVAPKPPGVTMVTGGGGSGGGGVTPRPPGSPLTTGPSTSLPGLPDASGLFGASTTTTLLVAGAAAAAAYLLFFRGKP